LPCKVGCELELDDHIIFQRVVQVAMPWWKIVYSILSHCKRRSLTRSILISINMLQDMGLQLAFVTYYLFLFPPFSMLLYKFIFNLHVQDLFLCFLLPCTPNYFSCELVILIFVLTHMALFCTLVKDSIISCWESMKWQTLY
jgi:hypothetical protein